MSQPEPPPAMRAVVLTGHGGLDRLEYDQVRRAEADQLGVRVGVLDSAVNRARRRTTNGSS